MNPILRELRRNWGGFRALVRQALAEGVVEVAIHDATDVHDTFLRNAAGVLRVRNLADDDFRDMAAKKGEFSDRVKTNLVEPKSGDVLQLGGSGQRVKLPLVTSESGITNQEKYVLTSRNEERTWLADRPQTAVTATLLADYGDTSKRDNSRVAETSATTTGAPSMRWKPTYTHNIGCIMVQAWRSGTGTGGFRLEAYPDNGSGKPDTATLLGSSRTIDGTELGAAAGGLVACGFAAAIPVTAGTSYHFIPVRTGTQSILIGTDASSPTYADGTLLLYAGGGVWNELNEDAIFEVWGPATGGGVSGGAGAADASAISYTPAVLTDWDGDADPGNADDALDQLAERVDDIEPVDAAAPTGSLRTVGTGALQACAGNDSRLSDARTPTAHKDAHDPNDGSDPLDTAAASEIAGVQAAATGTAHTLARADHTHQIQHGITDNHLLTVDQADAADNDFAKFTANGLEGRSYAEVKSDLGLTDAAKTCIEMLDTDAGTASTTVPKYTFIVPFACTITDVEIILGGNQACGATSIIVDVHKIAAADRDTGGTGTTIYTTQANRPTIANTHRYALATDPDVTAIAAGDALVLYIDQAGTGVTICTIAITVTKT